MGGVFVRGGDYWQKASKEALDEHAKAPLSPVVIQELYPWVLGVGDHFQEPLADNGSYYKYVSIIKLSGPQKMHCAQQGLTAQP